MKPSKTYYYWLDPLRALAALLVLFVHARSVMFDLYMNLEPTSQNVFTQIFYFICSQGHISVATFFILSGFLVGGRNVERLLKNAITPKSFIVNRIFRIGVPLTGAVALITAVDLIMNNPISLIPILGQYIGLQFIVGDIGGVFWTLSYEIWFYLILFSIILIFSVRKNILLGVIALAICCCVLIQLKTVWFCIIVAGMTAYRLKDIEFSKSIRILAVMTFILFLMLYFLSTPTSNISIFKTIKASYNLPIWIICCWAFAIVLSQLVKCKPTSKFNIWLDYNGRKLATFSYSLFLTHYQILKLYKMNFDKFTCVNAYSIMIFLGVCLICVVFAWLFYLMFEKNTIIIQKRIVGKFNQNEQA